MDNFWSNSLFFDDGLDVLVNVVVPSFTGDSGRFRGGVDGIMDGGSVFVLGCVALEETFHFLVAAVSKGSFFGR
jgi:hypothetical protein